jgi:hypothetical protein
MIMLGKISLLAGEEGVITLLKFLNGVTRCDECDLNDSVNSAPVE